MALNLQNPTDPLSILVSRYNATVPLAKQITDDVNFLIEGPFAPVTGPNASGASINTELKVTAKAGMPKRGRIRIRYQRKNLATVTGGPAGWGNDTTTVLALLPILNAKYGLNLLPEDVTDGPITLASTTLTVKPTSLQYYSTLTFGPSSVRSLTSALPNNVLDGFALPA